MEIRMNKEIRDYKETVFFGMNLRQLCCAVIASGVAVVLYFLLRHRVGAEVCSWICILGAAPFGALGFVSYHGMNAEQLFLAWVRDRILEPKTYTFGNENLYDRVLKTERKQSKWHGIGKAAWKRKQEDTGSRDMFRT